MHSKVCSCGTVRYQDGEWDGEPDPLGQAMTARRLARLTPEERHEHAVQASATRWAGKKKAEKREYMRQLAQRPRPSRRRQPEEPNGR